MNWDIIEGSWLQYKSQIKAQWSELTNGEIDIIDGHRDRLICRIQDAYGVRREEADRQIQAFQKYLKESLPA
jgi:uncharacterized protein YjbJ (UPF0337 family)